MNVDEMLDEAIEPAELARSLRDLSSGLALGGDRRDRVLARWAEEWGATLVADISHRSVAVGRLLTIRIFLQQGLASAMRMIPAIESAAGLLPRKSRIRSKILKVLREHARPMMYNSWLSEGAALHDTTAMIQAHAVLRSQKQRGPGELADVN